MHDIPSFPRISEDIKKLLLFGSNKKTFQPSSYLFMDGGESEYFYIIEKGKIKILKSTLEGEELTLSISKENEIIGEFSLFQKNTVHTNSAMALEKTTVWVLERETLENLIYKNSTIAVYFMKCMGIIHQRNQSKFRDLLLFGKHGALYSTLTRMCNTYGKETEKGIYIDLHLTNQELGEFINAPRETVNRMLGFLKKENVISMKGGYITVHNLSFFKNYLQCDQCGNDICQI